MHPVVSPRANSACFFKDVSFVQITLELHKQILLLIFFRSTE